MTKINDQPGSIDLKYDARGNIIRENQNVGGFSNPVTYEFDLADRPYKVNYPCVHVPMGSGRKAARHPAFKALNTVLGNIKSAIPATFRSVNKKHAPRRLAEFEYRFNRRYDLPAMIPRLGWVAVRTPPPMPYRLLKLAEDHG